MLWETGQDYSLFLERLVEFTQRKTIVEVGVAYGSTTVHLALAARKTGGKVFGFDCWSVHGLQNQFHAFSSRAEVDYKLKTAGIDNVELFEVDTKSSTFKELLSQHCPVIDFAFIDGCHSYKGVSNDYEAIRPHLADDAIVAFHDTQRIDGIREFVLDLRTKFNDGTFDYIDLPYGGSRRAGLGVMLRRKYPNPLEIDEVCGAPSTPAEIVSRENAWYQAQLRG